MCTHTLTYIKYARNFDLTGAIRLNDVHILIILLQLLIVSCQKTTVKTLNSTKIEPRKSEISPMILRC